MRHAGFTLVEMLLVGVTMSFMGGAAIVLANAGNRTWLLTDRKLALMTDAQRSMNLISEDLRRASSPCLVCAGGLQMARTTNGVCNAATQVSYQQQGNGSDGSLVRTANSVPQTVGTGVAAFMASCQPNGLVQVTVTVQPTAGMTNAPSYSLTSNILVQNP